MQVPPHFFQEVMEFTSENFSVRWKNRTPSGTGECILSCDKCDEDVHTWKVQMKPGEFVMMSVIGAHIDKFHAEELKKRLS